MKGKRKKEKKYTSSELAVLLHMPARNPERRGATLQNLVGRWIAKMPTSAIHRRTKKDHLRR